MATEFLVFDEVKKDLDLRNAKGFATYGGPMKPNDGRDSLQDAYEEALDMAMYLKKLILERSA